MLHSIEITVSEDNIRKDSMNTTAQNALRVDLLVEDKYFLIYGDLRF